jgi:sulfide:quinone oxidoreductase
VVPAAMHPLSCPPGQRPVVLIAGGGIAALEGLLALRDLAGDRVAVRMVASSPWFSHRPLAVAEPFGGQPAPRFDLRRICADQDAQFEEGTLERVDPDRKHAFTTSGEVFDYDALVVALGAQRHSWLHEAATLFGPGYADRIGLYLREASEGLVESIAFVVPPAETWPFPIYELALLAARRASERDWTVALKIVTPEAEPLEVFGGDASDAVRELLARAGVQSHLGCSVKRIDGTSVSVVPHGAGPIAADRVVTLPRLTGPKLAGLPTDHDGFLPVDAYGRIVGEPDIYAAGDATALPIKQGGVAAQHADTVAAHIAARTGASSSPEPFRPILRAVLLTGDDPLYLQAEITGGRGGGSVAARRPLSSPVDKLVAGYIPDYLFGSDAAHGPVASEPGEPPVREAAGA